MSSANRIGRATIEAIGGRNVAGLHRTDGHHGVCRELSPGVWHIDASPGDGTRYQLRVLDPCVTGARWMVFWGRSGLYEVPDFSPVHPEDLEPDGVYQLRGRGKRSDYDCAMVAALVATHIVRGL